MTKTNEQLAYDAYVTYHSIKNDVPVVSYGEFTGEITTPWLAVIEEITGEAVCAEGKQAVG